MHEYIYIPSCPVSSQMSFGQHSVAWRHTYCLSSPSVLIIVFPLFALCFKRKQESKNTFRLMWKNAPSSFSFYARQSEFAHASTWSLNFSLHSTAIRYLFSPLWPSSTFFQFQIKKSHKKRGKKMQKKTWKETY